MADSKLKDLTAKTTVVASDEFYGNDVAGGDLDKKYGADDIRTFMLPTNAQTKTAYEANADTNEFSDAEQTLLGNQSGTNTGDESAASVTVQGIVELATIAEVNTGTDATRAVTPDSLEGSALQIKVDGIEALADVTDITNVNAAAATVVGTIATGVWEATAVASAFLDSDTAHLTTTQTFSGAKTFSSILTMSGVNIDVAGNNIDNIQNLIHDVSTSGTDIDFNEDEIQTISISANTTFTTANRAAVRSKTLKITTDGTLRTFTFPAWDWVSAIPADQAASKNGYLTLTSYSTTDAAIVAAYQVGSL